MVDAYVTRPISMLALLGALVGGVCGWAMPTVRSAGYGPNPRGGMDIDCHTALPGAEFASSPGDVVFINGKGRAALSGTAYHDCVGPLVIAELGGHGNVYTPREMVDYCISPDRPGPGGRSRRNDKIGWFLYAWAWAAMVAPLTLLSPVRADNLTANGTARIHRRYFAGSSGGFYIYICEETNASATEYSWCMLRTDEFIEWEVVPNALLGAPVEDQVASQCVYVPLDWKLPVTLGASILGVVVTLGRLGHDAWAWVHKATHAAEPSALAAHLV